MTADGNGRAPGVIQNGNNNAADAPRGEKRGRVADEVAGAEVAPFAAQVGDGEEDDEDPDEDGPPTPGAQRRTRKYTLWIFVDRDNGAQVICRCGCLGKEGADRLVYSGPTTGAVKQHMIGKHKALYDEFMRCKNANGNWERLLESIQILNDATVEKITKRRRRSDGFYSTAIAKNLEKATVAELKLMMWALSNRIPRIALDDVLFDSYLREVGTSPTPNRHLLQSSHLVELDNLVVKEFTDELASVKCVSLSADGYRDRVRRDWLNVTVYWCAPSKQKVIKWEIRLLKPDIIYLPSSATAENISLYISEVVDDFVRFFDHCANCHCILTST